MLSPLHPWIDDLKRRGRAKAPRLFAPLPPQPSKREPELTINLNGAMVRARPDAFGRITLPSVSKRERDPIFGARVYTTAKINGILEFEGGWSAAMRWLRENHMTLRPGQAALFNDMCSRNLKGRWEDYDVRFLWEEETLHVTVLEPESP